MIESPVRNTWEQVGTTMVLFCPRRHLMETVPVRVFEDTSEASHLFAQALNCPGCRTPECEHGPEDKLHNGYCDACRADRARRRVVVRGGN